MGSEMCIRDRIPDLYDLAHVAGWEPCNLHDLGQVSWVGSVLICTVQILQNLSQRQVRNVDDLDHDLSHLSVRGVTGSSYSELFSLSYE